MCTSRLGCDWLNGCLTFWHLGRNIHRGLSLHNRGGHWQAASRHAVVLPTDLSLLAQIRWTWDISLGRFSIWTATQRFAAYVCDKHDFDRGWVVDLASWPIRLQISVLPSRWISPCFEFVRKVLTLLPQLCIPALRCCWAILSRAGNCMRSGWVLVPIFPKYQKFLAMSLFDALPRIISFRNNSYSAPIFDALPSLSSSFVRTYSLSTRLLFRHPWWPGFLEQRNFYWTNMLGILVGAESSCVRGVVENVRTLAAASFFLETALVSKSNVLGPGNLIWVCTTSSWRIPCTFSLRINLGHMPGNSSGTIGDRTGVGHAPLFDNAQQLIPFRPQISQLRLAYTISAFAQRRNFFPPTFKSCRNPCKRLS